MDQTTLSRLNARAQQLAEKIGVNASVSLNEPDPSRTEPAGSAAGGARVVLTVFHDAAARRQRDFRPDVPDLQARIEEEIPVLAQELAQH